MEDNIGQMIKNMRPSNTESALNFFSSMLNNPMKNKSNAFHIPKHRINQNPDNPKSLMNYSTYSALSPGANTNLTTEATEKIEKKIQNSLKFQFLDHL